MFSLPNLIMTAQLVHSLEVISLPMIAHLVNAWLIVFIVCDSRFRTQSLEHAAAYFLFFHSYAE